MEKQDMIGRLVNMYYLLERDEKFFEEDDKAVKSLRDQKFGVRMAAIALGVWDDVIEKIEQERLTQAKS